jgi:hypothetical protein
MAGEGLVIVDIDDYSGNDDVPDSIKTLPATFTVQTPHGGEHRYYSVDDSVTNSQNDWGDIQATNQYVVGPGSILDSCSKDWHDCSGDKSGRYTILDDRSLAHISSSAFPELTTKEARSPTATSTPSSKVICLDDVDAPFGELETRLQAFLDKDRRKALWNGRYSKWDTMTARGLKPNSHGVSVGSLRVTPRSWHSW